MLLADHGSILGTPGLPRRCLKNGGSRSWGALGTLTGRSWGALGRSWAALGRSWSPLGELVAALGALLGG